MFRDERQEVTGLIVNRKANVWRRDISLLRMKLHSVRIHGPSKAAKLWIGETASPTEFWQHIAGWLSYIRQVRGPDDPVTAKLCKMAVIGGLRGVSWIAKHADLVREFDVFLSHASEDKPKIVRLKHKLEALEVKVFFDADSIKWGETVPEKINHGLLRSSFFVPFLTETFSEKGWTNKELNSAINLNISRQGRILPICDSGFSVMKNYPLLSDILYKTWPIEVGSEETFLDTVADEILKKIQALKSKPTDLSG